MQNPRNPRNFIFYPQSSNEVSRKQIETTLQLYQDQQAIVYRYLSLQAAYYSNEQSQHAHYKSDPKVKSSEGIHYLTVSSMHSK